MTGLTIAVVFGGLVTQYYASKIKILVGEDNPEYRISIPISIGFVDGVVKTLHLLRCHKFTYHYDVL